MSVLKVYYIDDEPDLCSIFTDAFSAADITITTFTDPLKGIEETKKNPPDLIFLDYRLPFMNGDQVALKMDAAIPKFLISGDLTHSTVYKFQNIFSKPYDILEIQEVLRAALLRV